MSVDRFYCSFCGIGNHEVEVMIAGPVRTFICDKCVDECVDTIAKKKKDDAYMADVVRCAFCTPLPILKEVT